MEIYQATNEDIPQIVQLLKKSLGDSLVPKSEGYFIWKHLSNHFGKSYINIAREGNELIGVRTFMRWEFRKGDETVTAVRAVDTATHPEHQGKGIFKKLTMGAVEDCTSEGVGLVFNSPNNQSRPGYLKMGWQDAGRMPIAIRPGWILPALHSESKTDQLLSRFSISEMCNELDGEEFPVPEKIYHTPLSVKYLEWRFKDCPVARYGGVAKKGSFGLVFRVKPLKSFSEMRICEQWCYGKSGMRELNKAIGKLIKAGRPALVTAAPSPFIEKKAPLFFGPFQKGPITTMRQLNYTQLGNFAGFNAWQPSIGTMELF